MQRPPASNGEYRAARQLVHLAVQVTRARPRDEAAQQLLADSGRLLSLLVGAAWDPDAAGAYRKLRQAADALADVAHGVRRLRCSGGSGGGVAALLAAGEVAERAGAGLRGRLAAAPEPPR
jgi:hypothetical protein